MSGNSSVSSFDRATRPKTTHESIATIVRTGFLMATSEMYIAENPDSLSSGRQLHRRPGWNAAGRPLQKRIRGRHPGCEQDALGPRIRQPDRHLDSFRLPFGHTQDPRLVRLEVYGTLRHDEAHGRLADDASFRKQARHEPAAHVGNGHIDADLPRGRVGLRSNPFDLALERLLV